MKIAVCDDDKAAREHIVSLVKEQIQDAEIMAFATGEDRETQRALLFL